MRKTSSFTAIYKPHLRRYKYLKYSKDDKKGIIKKVSHEMIYFISSLQNKHPEVFELSINYNCMGLS